MTLKLVRLELGREPAFPEGSAQHGYEIVAPLKPDGQLDAREWQKYRDACTVRRFWPDEDDRLGHLRHTGSHWRLHYPGDEVEDDPVYKLGTHKLAPGEYVSIDEDDGERHTYRVMSVEPV